MKSSVIGIFLLFVLPLCCIAQVEYCDYSPKFSAATVSKIQSYQSLKKIEMLFPVWNLFLLMFV